MDKNQAREIFDAGIRYGMEKCAPKDGKLWQESECLDFEEFYARFKKFHAPPESSVVPDLFVSLAQQIHHDCVLKGQNLSNITDCFSELQEAYKKEQNSFKDLLQSEAVEFAEWIRTFEALERKQGFWIIEDQISSEYLYKGFLKNRELWRDSR